MSLPFEFGVQNAAEDILAASPDCVKILSADGVLRFINDSGLALLEGESRDAVHGLRYADLWPLDMRQRVIDAIAGAAKGETTHIEGYCPTLKGTPRWWEAHFQRVNRSSSVDIEVIGVTRDVSDRHARELALHERMEGNLRDAVAELDESKRRTTEFIATLAHELRNPLAPIRTGLQMMRVAGDDGAALGDVREMMERQVGQMVHLISELLDIARVTSGKIELRKTLVELGPVLAAALEASAALIADVGHALTMRIPPEALCIEGDAVRLVQIFTNILNNAATYTTPGGRISVTVSRTREQVTVDIGDSGIGIAPEQLDSIFEMFTKVSAATGPERGGLGMGLNLARRLVTLHGGSVVAASEGLGRGSHFVVTLPLAALGSAYSPIASAASPPATPATTDIKVLVVDDNVDAASSLSMLLELAEHTTRVANDGAEALRMACEFKPDIVFLDIGMPGMNGYEVAAALRAMPEAGDPVLVALSGWGAESDRLRSKSAGFDAHLTKPADIEVIETLLSRLAPRGR